VIDVMQALRAANPVDGRDRPDIQEVWRKVEHDRAVSGGGVPARGRDASRRRLRWRHSTGVVGAAAVLLVVSAVVGLVIVLGGHSRQTVPAAGNRGSGAGAHGPLGSAGNPQVLSCNQEVQSTPGNRVVPRRQDVVAGPLRFPNGRLLRTGQPNHWGSHGRYKIPVVLAPGANVTLTIAKPARRYVVISDPYIYSGHATSATYHACKHGWGAFVQGFTFTDGRTRGCVPLAVRIGGEARVRYIILALFDRACPHLADEPGDLQNAVR
jgi:hypothetical protein